jgi:hypothetical protein
MIDIQNIAAALTESSWMDRLDLTSPSPRERDRAAIVLATAIAQRLDGTIPAAPDARQMALPIS